MRSWDGKLVVTFNGEIYNHHELRTELEGKGAKFVTRCDTEVLLEGFRMWGEGLVERLHGMFAFGVLNQESGQSLLARDRLGKKPLFVLQRDEGLYFASEPRSFFSGGILQTRIDGGALREFLAFRYVPGRRTLFEGLEELLPGHFWQWGSRETPREHCYWKPAFGEKSDCPSEENAAEELRVLLENEVGDRLESEVPLGAFLSGGVDSAAVVYAMREKMGGDRLQAVTVGFEDPQFDERPHARALSRRLGIHLFEECLQPDPNHDLPRLVEIMDQPQLDSSLWPTFLVSEAARKHVTVALSGDGGDESFGGYRRYRFDKAERELRHLLPMRIWSGLGNLYPKGDRFPRWLRAKRTLQNLGRGAREAYLRSVASLMPEEVEELLLPEVGLGQSAFQTMRKIWDGLKAQDPDQKVLEFDLKTWLPGDILTKVDRASMAVSLEVRCPMLDHRIVDFAARLPASYKFDRREGKILPKRAFQPWLGESWLARKKKGFSIPLAAWLRGPLWEQVMEARKGAFAEEHFRPETLDLYLTEHKRGSRDRSEALWAVLILHLWKERWGKSRAGRGE
jgi:asparagine synthase (glutamine-hydrolysing)